MTLMERRRALMAVKKGGGGIPGEYQRCEYIKTPKASGKHLKTDVGAMNTTRAEFRLTKSTSTSGPIVINSSGATPFGAINNSQSTYVCSPVYLPNVTITTPTDFTFTKSVTGSASAKVWLFSWSSAAWVATMEIYYAKLYQGDTLAFDGVPAYRKSDGMAGLWDYVSEAFYPGTEEYTKGPDVT